LKLEDSAVVAFESKWQIDETIGNIFFVGYKRSRYYSTIRCTGA
jgi:hypothetical protein